MYCNIQLCSNFTELATKLAWGLALCEEKKPMKDGHPYFLSSEINLHKALEMRGINSSQNSCFKLSDSQNSPKFKNFAIFQVATSHMTNTNIE